MKQLVSVVLAIVGPLVLVARSQDGMLFPSTAGSYVNVASTPDLSPQNAITVESWFYCDPASPLGGNRPAIVRKDPSGSSYILRNSDNNNGHLEWILWTQTSGISTVTSPNPTPLLSWHHYAGTYDGSAMRMFLDGVEIASVPKTGLISIAPGPVTLGQGGGSSDTWNGYIDEIRIWSVARTAAQIQSTMSLRIDNQPGLIAAWHFDGNYLDLTGNHTGTAVGSPVILASTSPVLSIYVTAPALAPIGTALALNLYVSPPSVPYVVDVSVNGTVPGTTIPPPGSGVFPLNMPFLYHDYGAMNPTVFQNFYGFTSASGYATAVLNIPANVGLSGTVISAAFIVVDGLAPFGIGRISNASQTTITGFTPTIGSVTPPTGPTVGGWGVTITGTNFQPGATVRFGGSLATSVAVTPTSISCFTPSGPLGSTSVEIHNPDGNQTTLVNGFTYVPTLMLLGASPVVAGAGATVTISALGLTAGLSANLGGVALTVGALTPSSFTFVVPAGTFCSAPLVVTLADGQSATFTINPIPVITGIVGPPGVPAGGSTAFVLGSSFFPGTTVTVGGAPATILASTQSAILIVTPPHPSGTVPLVVTSSAGCPANSTYTYQ